MRHPCDILLLWFISLASSSLPVADAGGDTSLNFVVPSIFSRQEGYDHSPALFGFPPHAGRITQNIIYADDTICDRVDTTKGYPRTPNNPSWAPPFILMVDRGHCTFLQQVRNAQIHGAAAVLIANNACVCSDNNCTSTEPCESTMPIMADDGSGSDVSIPSFLVSKNDASKIENELLSDRSVLAQMTWGPVDEDRVEYSVWTSPLDSATGDSVLNFKNYALALGRRAYFTPHMDIYDGIRAGCMDDDGSKRCEGLCTNHGRYCATDAVTSKGVVSGAAIVAESLRRICIWTHYGADTGIGEKWWDYVHEFSIRCSHDPRFFNDAHCVKDSYHHGGIDGRKIERCIKDSGGLSGKRSNSKLDLELAAKSTNGVVTLPSAFIGRNRLQEKVTAKNVFTAICNAYGPNGVLPDICRICPDCSNVQSCTEDGMCKPQLLCQCETEGSGKGDRANFMDPVASLLDEDGSGLADITTMSNFIVALLLFFLAAPTALYFQRRTRVRAKVVV